MSQLAVERKRRNFTQKELAGLTPYSRSSLAQVEAGRSIAWPKFRKAMSEALSVPEDQLFPESLQIKE